MIFVFPLIVGSFIHVCAMEAPLIKVHEGSNCRHELSFEKSTFAGIITLTKFSNKNFYL